MIYVQVTIFTGIEKGYEKWLLEGPENEEEKVTRGLYWNVCIVYELIDWLLNLLGKY